MAETIEELLVKLSADVRDYNKNLESALRKTDNSTKKMDKDFEKLAKNTERSTQAMATAIGSFAGVLGANLLSGAFNMATQAAGTLFQSLIVDGVAAAQVQEDAINSLNQSLINAGRFSSEASTDMQDFASQLQSVTTIGDETTIGLLSLANNFARSNDEAKRMVKAAIELDAAMGIGLDSALKNLGKTTSGLTGELGESLPALRSLTTEQLKAGAAVDLILDKFSGSAAAAAKTYSGALQQLKNTWGDTTEQVGFAITQNLVVIEIFNEGKKILEEFNGQLADNNTSFKEVVGEGVVLLIDGLGVLIDTFDFLARIGKFALNSIEFTLRTATVPLRAMVKVLTGDFKGAWDTIADAVPEGVGNMKGALESFSDETLLGKFSESLNRVGETGKKALESIGTSADKTKTKMGDQAEEINKLLEAEKLFIDELIGYKTSQAEAELAIIDNKKAAELEKLNQFREQDKVSEEQYQNAVTGLNKKFAAQRKTIRDRETKEDEANRQARIQGVQSMFGALATFQNSKSKEMAAVGKSAAVFNATISAYEGGNKAAAAVAGIPIVGPALAAAARIAFIAQGIAQVQRIRGVAYRHGTDSVPGFGMGDRVPAMLEPKERVVPRKTNQDLTQYLAMAKQNMGGGGGGGPVHLLIEYVGDAAETIRARQIENSYLNVGVEGAI